VDDQKIRLLVGQKYPEREHRFLVQMSLIKKTILFLFRIFLASSGMRDLPLAPYFSF
jgi:hypothetical protein